MGGITMKHEIEVKCNCPTCNYTFYTYQTNNNSVNTTCNNCKVKADIVEITQSIRVSQKEWKNNPPTYIPSHPGIYKKSKYRGNETHNERYIKFLQKNHFCMSEPWDLFTKIARFIVPRLKEMIKNPPMGHPADITYEQWIEYLNNMLYSMEIISTDSDDWKDKEQQDKIQRGLNLLHEYFKSLWD